MIYSKKKRETNVSRFYEKSQHPYERIRVGFDFKDTHDIIRKRREVYIVDKGEELEKEEIS